MSLTSKRFLTYAILATLFLTSIFFILKMIPKKRVKPDAILKEVKSYFMDVKATYILETPIKKEELYPDQMIYQGGISQLKENHMVQYEFYADAYSGKVLNIVEI